MVNKSRYRVTKTARNSSCVRTEIPIELKNRENLLKVRSTTNKLGEMPQWEFTYPVHSWPLEAVATEQWCWIDATYRRKIERHSCWCNPCKVCLRATKWQPFPLRWVLMTMPVVSSLFSVTIWLRSSGTLVYSTQSPDLEFSFAVRETHTCGNLHTTTVDLSLDWWLQTLSSRALEKWRLWTIV